MGRKVSVVKEKSIRFQEFLEEAKKSKLKEVFSTDVVNNSMIAKRLGYSDSRFSGIKNGNCDGSLIEKCARTIASWIDDGSLNAEYVCSGTGKIFKERKLEHPKSVQLDALPTVDMDDSLDDDELEALDIADETQEETQEQTTPATEVHDDDSCPQYDFHEEHTSLNNPNATQEAGEFAEKYMQEKKPSNKNAVRPKTAKDKWADDAIALGIKEDALDDHFMQMYTPEDGKMHLFKEASGNLPYRQEVFNVMAVGVGKPETINYYDDKFKFTIKYAVVYESEITYEASSEDEANAHLIKTLGSHHLYVGGKKLNMISVYPNIAVSKK